MHDRRYDTLRLSKFQLDETYQNLKNTNLILSMRILIEIDSSQNDDNNR